MKTPVLLLAAALACRAAIAAPAAAELLAQAREAAGGAAWDGVAQLEARGRIVTSGLPGRWHRSEDLRRGRFTEAADVGVFRVSEGFDGTRRWRQDPSGGVHDLDAPFSRAMRVTDAWLARRGWLRGEPGVALGEVAEREDAGRVLDVVTATPQDGQAVELQFDARTHLLARSVRRMPISTQTVAYADYRAVGGLQLPHRIESGDSGSGNLDVVTITNWTRSAPRGAAFAPAKPPADATLAAPTTVPVEIDGMVTVTASLNGHAYDFILDTGGHDIVTPAVAQALGLKPVGAGASGGAGAGTIAQQDVRVASVRIGAATLRDQHFYVIPLQYMTVERGARPPLAGIIGLELFERFDVRLDYAARTLTLRTFAQAAREERRGTPVPIAFDDDMPLVEARIDGRPGLAALDTGNSGTAVVQAAWARRVGLADAMKRGLETVSYGAGGESRNWASRLESIELGGQVVAHPVARYAEDSAGAFSSITEAANLGTEVLAHFALDFDYHRGTLWLEPRPGRKAEPFNRSGLRAYKADASAFVVALVTPGSPAAEAGLRKDERIVAVDGVPAERLGGRELLAKTTQAPGTVVDFTVADGTTTRHASVTLRELLP